VQRVKGQMYCTVCTAPCNLRATVQKEATVLFLRARQAAATFLLPMHKYGRSFLLSQDGVSGVHKMTTLYNVYSIAIKHMNRPLHLYMLEMFTPYLFKSNRRKTFQEHPNDADLNI
jgi:hypothetical protein